VDKRKKTERNVVRHLIIQILFLNQFVGHNIKWNTSNHQQNEWNYRHERVYYYSTFFCWPIKNNSTQNTL